MDIKQIKKLRELTGAGVMDAKTALESNGNDFDKAVQYLKAKGIEKAAKKSEREIKAGRIFSYIHGGRVGALVKVGCETDFVAKNAEFEKLGNEVAMQVAAMGVTDIAALLAEPYIRDASKTIEDLVTDTISKIGENITIVEVVRLEI
jgi:elongation factor Ts